MNHHCKQINPAAALQYGMPSWKQVANRCADPSNFVESKKQSTFLILQVQSLLPSFTRALWTWRGTSGQVWPPRWLGDNTVPRQVVWSSQCKRLSRSFTALPTSERLFTPALHSLYLISHLLTHMNTSNLSNECFIEPSGQALSMYFSALTGSMLQIIIGLPPHSVKSASKK